MLLQLLGPRQNLAQESGLPGPGWNSLLEGGLGGLGARGQGRAASWACQETEHRRGPPHADQSVLGSTHAVAFELRGADHFRLPWSRLPCPGRSQSNFSVPRSSRTGPFRVLILKTVPGTLRAWARTCRSGTLGTGRPLEQPWSAAFMRSGGSRFTESERERPCRPERDRGDWGEQFSQLQPLRKPVLGSHEAPRFLSQKSPRCISTIPSWCVLCADTAQWGQAAGQPRPGSRTALGLDGGLDSSPRGS